MSKSVLISIKPEWCELIANGNKTIEVRKTRPKLKTPFKCYIYCTLPKSSGDIWLIDGENPVQGNGKVIGEFVCDKITELAPINRSPDDVEERACLTRIEIVRYLKGRGYAWHISDLVIYDWPRALCLFNHPHYKDCDIECGNCKYGFPTDELSFEDYICYRALQRAPQSWCYVEEV